MARIKGKDLYLKNDDQIYFGDGNEAAMWFDNGELFLNHTISGVDPTENYHLVTKGYMTSSGVINHDHLYGLEDDDHSQYILVDGSRAFTSTVGGVDPTDDPHLVTLSFMQAALLGTASGIPQVGNILFGSEFEYEIDSTESSSNSTTYLNKLTLTASGVTGNGIPDGAYRLGWHFEWRISKSNADFNYRIRYDDTTDFKEDSISPFVDTSVWNPISNFFYIENVVSGTHTFELDYSSSSASATAYIREVRFEFWRVS